MRENFAINQSRESEDNDEHQDATKSAAEVAPPIVDDSPMVTVTRPSGANTLTQSPISGADVSGVSF